ncbi:MAG: hypothetical protein IJ389_03245 [Clostridia bacterium]|nr:hypothetical protein [Clostridia bacterium]
MRKRKNNVEYTHNGSPIKSFFLLIGSIINMAVFAFFWYAIHSENMTMVIIGTVALTVLVMVNFVFPAVKKR